MRAVVLIRFVSIFSYVDCESTCIADSLTGLSLDRPAGHQKPLPINTRFLCWNFKKALFPLALSSSCQHFCQTCLIFLLNASFYVNFLSAFQNCIWMFAYAKLEQPNVVISALSLGWDSSFSSFVAAVNPFFSWSKQMFTLISSCRI